MSLEEKRRALRYLMSLKKKRCGRIEGRGCADGRSQRVYTGKEDASAPTVFIESAVLSCIQDANENRDVATVDLPGAFMHADIYETVHIKLVEKMAELLVMAQGGTAVLEATVEDTKMMGVQGEPAHTTHAMSIKRLKVRNAQFCGMSTTSKSLMRAQQS